jgi:Tol biopolymer transport system component
VRIYEIDRLAGVTRLVGSPRADDASYEDSMPARLADGRVVMVSDRGGRPGLFLVSPDGARAEPLAASVGARDTDPAPLGRDRIVFARSDAGGPRDLFVVRTDGGEIARLTRHPSDDGAPCATPDGGSIVFVSDRDGAPRLYRLSPGAPDPESTVSLLSPPEPRIPGGGLAGTAAGSALEDRDPACLPGGSIAFSRSIGGGPAQVFLVDLGGRSARQITDPLVLPYGAGEPISLGAGALLLTAGPVPPSSPVEGPRFAAYTITEGGFNLARVTRDGVGYSDFARRLRLPR